MKARKRLLMLGAMAASMMGAGQVNAATVVNVPSTAAGTTLFLDAGTYAFNFIGTSSGGAFDGWSPWADSARWAVNLALDLGDGAGQFDRTNGYYYYQQMQPGNDHYYETAVIANAQALSAAFLTVPLTPSPSYLRPAAETGPFSFTLANAQSVNFLVKDSVYGDNRGGVSVSLLQLPEMAALAAVPEPESWALMLSGFALVGFVMRRRSVRHSRVMPA